MDAALQELCTQSVSHTPWTGQNASGEPTFGSATSYKAQVSGQNRLVWDSAGKQVLSSLRVIFAQYVAINPKDKLTLPSGYPVSSPPILSVDLWQNDEGQDHTTVHLR